jgi:putative phosphoesterase
MSVDPARNGTTRVGIISDTHGMMREEALAALKGVDLILHAGDVGSAEVLDALQSVAPVHAVRGNMDSMSLGLPVSNVVQVGRSLLYMVHDLGWLDLDPEVAGVAAVVSGHTHLPMMRQQGSVLFFNPGSAGPRRYDYPISVGCLSVSEEGLEGELIELSIDR